MGAAQVVDMHVVTQAGAVRGGVVIPKNLERGPLALGRPDRERDQVGFGIVVLADGGVLGGAGGIEVTEGREAQALAVGEGF